MSTEFNSSNIAEMNPITLYEVLKLRTDVFVVEQNCPYPELDGRDLEPDCELIWPLSTANLPALPAFSTTTTLYESAALSPPRITEAPASPANSSLTPWTDASS